MLKSRYTAYCVVFLPAGIILTLFGLYKIISNYLVMKKNYVLISAKITNYEKEVRYRRYGKSVYYYPTLQFEYEGHTYVVRDPNGLSEEARDGFEKYVGDTAEVRVPENDPYSAMLNYEQSLYRKYKDGAVCIAVGLLCIFASVMLMFAM